MQRSHIKNRILTSMAEADFEHVQAHLAPVDLRLRQVLLKPNAPVDFVYFPESSQISVMAKVPRSLPIEAGMIGWEGMSDLGLGGRSSLLCVCQLAGRAYRLDQDVLLEKVARSHTLADLVMRWQACLISQLSYTALSHGSFNLEQRLARWLLMMHDRVEGDDIPAVHEFFSHMLSVRRAGITEALKALSQEGAISCRRGLVTIADRQKLVACAARSYGAPEQDYERLFGPFGKSEPQPRPSVEARSSLRLGN